MKIQKIVKPYLVIHYDVADETVREKIRTYPGVRRASESVSLLAGSTDEAEKLWKFIADESKGLWMKDNRLVIHFVGGNWSGMIWIQIFVRDDGSLDGDPDLQFLAYWADELTKATE